jgi:hypothetical protein
VPIADTCVTSEAAPSPTEIKAFVFDFESSIQANYDGHFVIDRGSSVVVQFPDTSLSAETVSSLSAFGTVEGEDVSTDVSAQLL